MTDDKKETNPRSYRSSIGLPATIPEEPSSGTSTISALVNSTPLADPAAANGLPNGSSYRPRRRSSVSILQALVNSSHSIATKDVRSR
jgi:hypothetical protein